MSRILIVDEKNQERRRLRELVCDGANWTAVCTDNANDALELLETQVFDLVVSAIELPGMDGFELLKELKAHYPRTPLMLVASEGNEDLAMQSLNHGAAGYIPSHLVESDFLESVGRILGAKEDDLKRERLLDCINHSEVNFIIDNDRSLIPVVLSRLQSSLKLFEICDRSERLRVRMALEEAVANALFHGNLELDSEIKEHDFNQYFELADERRKQEPYKQRRIRIVERLTRDKAVFTVQDDGQGFDQTKLPDPFDPENLLRSSGRGIVMMNAFMDEVEFNEVGNQVTLTKYKTSSENVTDEFPLEVETAV